MYPEVRASPTRLREDRMRNDSTRSARSVPCFGALSIMYEVRRPLSPYVGVGNAIGHGDFRRPVAETTTKTKVAAKHEEAHFSTVQKTSFCTGHWWPPFLAECIKIGCSEENVSGRFASFSPHVSIQPLSQSKKWFNHEGAMCTPLAKKFLLTKSFKCV